MDGFVSAGSFGGLNTVLNIHDAKRPPLEQGSMRRFFSDFTSFPFTEWVSRDGF
jgi:hypothetical protein